jgi:hypothetical protein
MTEYKAEISDFKLKSNFILTQIRMTKEPKEELAWLRDALIEAAETNRMGTDEEFANTMYTTTCNITSKMAKERSYDKEVSNKETFFLLSSAFSIVP